MSTGEGRAGERHASWSELFFDLVVVAGVIQLSHLLHEASRGEGLLLFGLLYLAFWTTWVCFTVYGNVESRSDWTPSLVVAMLGLAVMAAAVPGILTSHADAFIVAYVFLRWLGGWVWPRGRVVVDWPLAQIGVGVLPWVVSFWCEGYARYALWAAGIAFDLLVILTASGTRLLRNAQERLDRVVRRRGRTPRDLPALEAARPDLPHLTERLGLYVIIVLGEGVIQITSATAAEVWNGTLVATWLGAFVLLFALWTMSLLHGYGGVPKLGPRDLSVRATLALHCLTTGALASAAAGMGLAAEHPGGAATSQTRWLLCGAVALYFAVGVLAALATGAGPRTTLAWSVPCLAGTLVLGVAGSALGGAWILWLLAIALCWQIAAAQWLPARRSGGHDSGAAPHAEAG